MGPYGSGKSAFAVFLADLLSPSGSPGAKAARKLLNESSDIALPRQRLHPVVLTAERAPLDTLLLKALGSTLESIWRRQKGAKPRVLKTIGQFVNGSDPELSRCATSDVVGCFEDALRAMAAKTGAGLLLMVDEAGKALEYAAQQPTRGDVYLLQALAEVAARTSGVPFVTLTVLHQSFEHYAHQLGPSDRNEWAKVQGRFGELAFREGGDQMIRLTAAAIRRTTERSTVESWTRIVSAAAAWVSEGTGWDRTQLAGHLDACWPLHPIAAALLGPLFHSRSAQNERSLFAFLSAGEPLSFRDFLRTHGPDEPLYGRPAPRLRDGHARRPRARPGRPAVGGDRNRDPTTATRIGRRRRAGAQGRRSAGDARRPGGSAGVIRDCGGMRRRRRCGGTLARAPQATVDPRLSPVPRCVPDLGGQRSGSGRSGASRRAATAERLLGGDGASTASAAVPAGRAAPPVPDRHVALLRRALRRRGVEADSGREIEPDAARETGSCC